MDRYQEEIRRVAAKSVRDLNLTEPSNRSLRMSNERRLSSPQFGHTPAATTTGAAVSVAAARLEYMQKVNQLNNWSGPSYRNKSEATLLRRQSEEPTTPQSTRLHLLSKSSSASSVLKNAGAAMNGRCSPSTHHQQSGLSPCTSLSSHPLITRQTSGGSSSSRSSSSPEGTDQQVFQPGVYPQPKRASLTSIPIYENLDDASNFPAIPRRGQCTPPPPPPPYTGHHHIVVNGKSILKVPSKGPPYVAPPVYENVSDEGKKT